MTTFDSLRRHLQNELNDALFIEYRNKQNRNHMYIYIYIMLFTIISALLVLSS